MTQQVNPLALLSGNNINENYIVKKKIVVRSINNADKRLCVDVFQIEDNTFGF